MASDNLTNALIFVMAVNVMLFFGQLAMINVNPGASQFYKCTESEIMKSMDKNGCLGSNYTFDKDQIKNDIPTASSNEDSSGQNFFTDIFNTLGGWIKATGQGLKFLLDIVGAPIIFLNIMLPDLPELAFGLAILWYALTIFLIISWLIGGR